MKRILGFTLLLLLLAGPALAADKISAAVAANFIDAFKEIAHSFEAKTGVPVEATYSSTGQLCAQIRNGAPYDLFLAADEERPALLHREGLAEAPFVYANGRVVLWTAKKDLCGARNWREVLANHDLKKISVANPKTAPYGASAMAALEKSGMKKNVEGRLVFGQNIAQAFQYAVTRSVDAGFCAFSSTLSEKGREGCAFSVEEAPAVVQAACLLKRTARQKDAREFIRFLSSPEAVSIKTKYGYR